MAPALRSNSRVAFSACGGPRSGDSSCPRTAAITRFTWLSASAAVTVGARMAAEHRRALAAGPAGAAGATVTAVTAGLTGRPGATQRVGTGPAVTAGPTDPGGPADPAVAAGARVGACLLYTS